MMSAPRMTGSGATARYAYVTVTYGIVTYASTWATFYLNLWPTSRPQPLRPPGGQVAVATRNPAIYAAVRQPGRIGRIARC